MDKKFKTRAVAMILAGGGGTRLDLLTYDRAKPAVTFGGKYRIIDFVLSNCVNSDIFTVGIMTQYFPRSLTEHVGIGKAWDLDRENGVTILSPYQKFNKPWYEGTANAVYQNLGYIIERRPAYVLVLPGDQICVMDYKPIFKQHEEKNADVTVVVAEVDKSQSKRFGMVVKNRKDEILEFEEKPDVPKSNLASLGIYIFKTEVLIEILLKYCGPQGLSDFGRDILPKIINEYKVLAHTFEGFWKDVGTVEEYWRSNLELTKEQPPIDVYDQNVKILTTASTSPPVKFGAIGKCINSLVSSGAIIKGSIENCVISSDVIIEEGAVVKNCVILNKTVIKKNCKIEDTIIDKNCVIGEGCQIGVGEVEIPNYEVPALLSIGLNIIGKFVNIPSNTIIERNCRILPRAQVVDFKTPIIKSGISIHPNVKENFYHKIFSL